MKNSFLLYADAYESIRSLEPELKGQLLDAVFLYHRGEVIPTLAPVVEMAFSFLRRSFERDESKYAERCEKARTSARARWDKNDANACERILDDAKHADSVPVPVPDTVFKTTPPLPREPGEVEQPKPAKQPNRTYLDHRPTACPVERWKKMYAYSWRFHRERAKTLGARAPFTRKKVLDGAKVLDNMTRVRQIESGQIMAAMDWAVTNEFWNEQVRALSSLTNISRNGDTKYANILTAMAKDLVRK